jgi:Lon protease-like protein
MSFLPDHLPDVIPVFPLSGALLLPGSQLPLHIFEPRYRAMINDALKAGRLIGMIQPRESGPDDTAVQEPPVYAVGCLGKITAFQEMEDGRFVITLTGVRRFRVEEELMERTTPYRLMRVSYAGFERDLEAETLDSLDRDLLMSKIRAYVDLQGYSVDWDAIEATDSETLIDLTATLAPFEPSEKQALLEAESLTHRADIVLTLLDMAIADSKGPSGSLQ